MSAKFSGIHNGEEWALEVSYDRFAESEPFVVDVWVNFDDKDGAAGAFLDPEQARSFARQVVAYADMAERANAENASREEAP
jgi:hypothetical protein